MATEITSSPPTTTEHGPRCKVIFSQGAELTCIVCGASTPPNTFTSDGCNGALLSTFALEHSTTLSTRLYAAAQSSARAG